jgi:light-regulated signal transduction histidine kinase (bacteriophytochrome)
LDEQADKYIYHITDGATRMQKMIDDLLEYSRVSTRKMPTAPTALKSVLAQVVADMEISIRENEANITHDPLPIVLSNKARITQVFQNLISNAIKFRQKGLAPTVHISA